MTKKLDYNQGSHKLLYHLDRVLEWSKGGPVFPLHLEIGTGPKCNFRCVFCFTEFQKANNYTLDRDTFLKIMDEAHKYGVRSIGILGDGEPTLNGALAEAITYGGTRGLDIGLSTNGLLFSEELAKSILPNLVWIRFTTCAATAATFEKIHQIPQKNFDTVLGNIRKSVEIKKQLGLPVTIGMQMVMVPENISEVVDAARLAKSLGVDYFVAKPTSISPNNQFSFDLDLYSQNQALLGLVEKESTDNFSAHVSWKKVNSRGIKPYEQCYGYAFLFQVTGNGEVFPCSHLVGKPEFLLGDFKTETLEEMVHGSRYQQVIKNIQDLNVREDCATCCRHESINEFLWGLKNPPDHINFI